MKSRYPIICGLSLLALAAGSVTAQEGEPKRPPGGDGAGRGAELLKRADKDGDGKVSKEEFVTMSKTQAEENFGRFDANSDGYVDQTEIGGIGERFRENMRGRGFGGEGEGGMRRPGGERPKGEGAPEGGFRRPPGERAEGAPARPEGGRPAGGPPDGRPNLDDIFSRMDKNNDGSVDKEEYKTFSTEEVEQRFNRADENADGKLSKEETRNAMERLRSMMRGPGGPGGPSGPEGARRPGGGPPEGGFRRPPSEGGEGRRPENEAPKKDEA